MGGLKRLEKDHVWTWIGHTFAAVFIPAFLMVLFKAFLLAWSAGLLGIEDLGFFSFIVYTALVTAMGYYYGRIREPKDKAEYGRKGTLDKRQADLTARVDGAGDALGPYAAAVAVLTGLTMWGPFWLPLVPIALALGYFGYETGRAAANTGRKA